MSKSCYRTGLLFLLMLSVASLRAQWTTTLPSGIRVGENMNNRLLFFGNAKETYKSLFEAMNGLVLKGEGNIQIVQIGDSHLQAGFIPEQMRKDFSSFVSSGCGARGMVFPYRVAKTNNPADYVVKFIGKWENCRNVELNKTCSLGLMGIMVQTRDTLAGMTFHFKETATFREFKFVRIFHDPVDTCFRIDFPGLEAVYHVVLPVMPGYTDIRFDSVIADSLMIRIIHKDTSSNYFTFYGIDFENGDPGIVYSASGVNGAEVTSYLRCDQMKEQLKLQDPDWVIISLGTNDAYPLHFDKDEFTRNYLALIKRIRDAKPDVPILLTVPGDSYRRHRYDNMNLVDAREAILSVAKQTGSAVWDFYTLMGGPKSIMNWYKAGLVARDKLHFNRQGYIIQADLLFGAFVDAWSSFIDQSNISE
jgi:lysophospholipase L1-like esterase